MYPGTDIPVLQLSVQPDRGPIDHIALGTALAPLRDDGVLMLASGGATHDLPEFHKFAHATETPAFVTAFNDWLFDRLTAGEIDDLVDYRARAPHAARNHPTEEHFLPLFIAMGAAGQRPKAERWHQSYEFGVFAMDAYAFSSG